MTLTPEAQEALTSAAASVPFGTGRDEFQRAIFAAGIAFGATAQQRQDAEYLKAVAANFRTIGLMDAANSFDTAVQQLLGAPHA